MQDRLDRAPKSMRVRRATVEHPFGTLKAWMGAKGRSGIPLANDTWADTTTPRGLPRIGH